MHKASNLNRASSWEFHLRILRSTRQNRSPTNNALDDEISKQRTRFSPNRPLSPYDDIGKTLTLMKCDPFEGCKGVPRPS